MQLRKTNLVLAVLCAAGLAMTACGDDETPTNCTSDADCEAGAEVCNTSAGVCMQTCTIGADCDRATPNCVAMNATNQTLVCKCSTDNICKQERGDETLVCQADGLCGTGVSGGNDPTTCTGEGQGTGTSVCKYGEKYCSAGTCTALPAPDREQPAGTSVCENYTNFTNKSELGTTGNIIYNVTTGTVTSDATYCGSSTAAKRVRFVIRAYSSAGFPESKDQLAGMFYVDNNGVKDDAVKFISSSTGNYARFDNNKRAEITLSLCRNNSSTTTLAGFYFSQGNFYCYRANYQ